MYLFIQNCLLICKIPFVLNRIIYKLQNIFAVDKKCSSGIKIKYNSQNSLSLSYIFS